jgi:hypothetical protein
VSWFNRLSNLLRRENLSRELDEELQFHIDARVRDNLKAGMTEEAAQHDARRRFGNWTLAKEKTHEINIIVTMLSKRSARTSVTPYAVCASPLGLRHWPFWRWRSASEPTPRSSLW